ncbi:MAG: homoserine dehydrogenase [Anaerolineaceae bacterium]|nr:homoserine dehydrogenase [Anaerolineaceae bacterium]
MKIISLALVGFGNVGQAFVSLLQRKQKTLQQAYGIDFRVVGICTGRHGMAIDNTGIDLHEALRLKQAGESLSSLSKIHDLNSVEEFIQLCPAEVLFENTPVNHHDGQPGIKYIKVALANGMHVVTANKGPVVHAYQELKELADQNKRKFRFESTVMDGAPIFSLFRNPLPAANIEGLYGVLNSTTNLILERMETGDKLDEAIEYAQSIGIAEADPGEDLDGWDASVKVSALVTVLMGQELKPQDVKRTGIRGITNEMVETAKIAGERWKLVCQAQRMGDKVEAVVGLQRVSTDSVLFNVSGTSSLVQFKMDVLPALTIIEGSPGPDTTAYGLLADFIDIYSQEVV